jgi:starvation-inducible DNA-binding protein
MKLGTGIEAEKSGAIVEGLSRLLADTYTLLLKTHNYHWNVKGPMFQTLHLLFEQQYNELFMASDTIAERIRALGHPVPATYAQFAKLTSIKEKDGVPKALEMVKDLLDANETVVRTARTVYPAAESAADESTLDMLTGRLNVHEKAAWMLRSHLED